MIGIKKVLRKNKTIVEIVWLVIGIALILLAGSLMNQTHSFLATICSGVGISILASAITVLTNTLLLEDEGDTSAENWGLMAVHNTRGAMNAACDLYIRKADYIEIIAFGLKSFRETQEDTAKRILEKGGYIRIITMVPYCDNLRSRERDEGVPEDYISHSIEDLIEWAKKMNGFGYQGKIEIKWHYKLPQEFLFRMDNRLFTGPYEYGRGSQQTISFEFSNAGDAYSYYANKFRQLWNDDKFCESVLNK